MNSEKVTFIYLIVFGFCMSIIETFFELEGFLVLLLYVIGIFIPFYYNVCYRDKFFSTYDLKDATPESISRLVKIKGKKNQCYT